MVDAQNETDASERANAVYVGYSAAMTCRGVKDGESVTFFDDIVCIGVANQRKLGVFFDIRRYVSICFEFHELRLLFICKR